MKLNRVLYSALSVAITHSVMAAEPAPVIDISPKQSISRSSGSLTDQISNIQRQQEARNRAQVNMQRQLDELLDEVNEIRGVTELHTHQLGKILERQRELYQELDRRVSQAIQPASQVPQTLAAPNGEQPASYSSNLSENEAYDRAVNLVLKEKQYDKAIPEFKRFIEQFPQSSYAANARYWLGQLLFNKGNYVEAKTEFSVVVSQFASSPKRSDAMLKLAMVEQKQNNKAQAIKVYRDLLNEYPNSSAAKLAKSRLATLTQ